jgi:hypothetical protein
LGSSLQRRLRIKGRKECNPSRPFASLKCFTSSYRGTVRFSRAIKLSSITDSERVMRIFRPRNVTVRVLKSASDFRAAVPACLRLTRASAEGISCISPRWMARCVHCLIKRRTYSAQSPYRAAKVGYDHPPTKKSAAILHRILALGWPEKAGTWDGKVILLFRIRSRNFLTVSSTELRTQLPPGFTLYVLSVNSRTAVSSRSYGKGIRTSAA